MTLDSLKLARAILFRTLIITFVFTLFMSFATMALWDVWTVFTARCYHMDAAQMGPVIVQFFGNVKLFAVFVLLAPALAIHWTIKKMEREPT